MALVSATDNIPAERAWSIDEPLTVYGAPEGADALVIAEAVAARQGLVTHIARDASRASAMVSAIS